MTIVQTFIVEPTSELAVCARWRAGAFSVLQASSKQELRSLIFLIRAPHHRHFGWLVFNKRAGRSTVFQFVRARRILSFRAKNLGFRATNFDPA